MKQLPKGYDMTPAKVRFAMLCSLAVLQAEIKRGDTCNEATEMITPALPLSGWLYLWTFTTPGVCDLPALSIRWNNFTRALRGKHRNVKWMRVYEPHTLRGGYHVHTVAGTKYDVGTMRKLATKWGFGRLNVTMIPATKAGYVAKYLSKHKRKPGEKSVRMWACQGFRGVSASDVIIRDSWTHWAIAHTVGFQDAAKWSWQYIFNSALRLKCGQTGINPCRPIQMNDKQNKVALELVSKGAMIRAIEFRNHEVREARKYIDGRASLSEKTYYVQYFTEANGKPCLVEEKLSDSYKPGDKVNVPMTKGQTAILEVTKVRDFKGAVAHEGLFHAVS